MPVNNKNSKNSTYIIVKLMIADNVTMIGKQIRGKFSFFSKPALSINMFVHLVTISANNPQVMIPIHKYILYIYTPPVPGNLVFITWEKTNVYTRIIANG